MVYSFICIVIGGVFCCIKNTERKWRIEAFSLFAFIIYFWPFFSHLLLTIWCLPMKSKEYFRCSVCIVVLLQSLYGSSTDVSSSLPSAFYRRCIFALEFLCLFCYLFCCMRVLSLWRWTYNSALLLNTSSIWALIATKLGSAPFCFVARCSRIAGKRTFSNKRVRFMIWSQGNGFV